MQKQANKKQVRSMAIILIMGVALLSGLGTNKLKAKDSANRLAGAITY
ncbi:MAG: hypothetical protein GY754_13945, partial [bacterium]|nr:hypothetical protein [bacterium]